VTACLAISCHGAPGHIEGASADARFVREKGAVWIDGQELVRMSLDGTGARPVFPGFDAEPFPVEDVTSDWKSMLLNGRNYATLLGDVATGAMRRVSALDHLYPTATFSPDGTRIAATVRLNGAWPPAGASDALYLIDAQTLAITVTVPVPAGPWPWRLQWSADGSALWLTMLDERLPRRWITVNDLVAHEGYRSPPLPMRPGPWHPVQSCPRSIVYDGGRDLSVAEPGAPPHVIVHEVGHRHGLMDVLMHRPSFSFPVFTPGCDYVVFQFDRRVWIADARGGGVGPVAEGLVEFLQPP
jgi:hypothetical protein